MEDSEEDIIPKKISRAKKRGAPQDDHSSAKDTSQDGRDDDDDEDDAEDASQDGLDNPTTSGIVHTPQDGHEDPEDTLQDGLGNPNVSSITPPIPANLVEPVLVGHETHFHVVTSGTEVGIFTNRYVYHSHIVVSCLLTHYQEDLQMHASSVNSLLV